MAEPTPIVDLATILATGAVFHGVRVRVMRCELADGRTVKIDLPEPSLPEYPDDPEDLAPTQRKIMTVLRGSPAPMTRITVAHKLKWATATGKFGVYLRDLIERGMVFENGQYVTNDASKFPE